MLRITNFRQGAVPNHRHGRENENGFMGGDAWEK